MRRFDQLKDLHPMPVLETTLLKIFQEIDNLARILNLMDDFLPNTPAFFLEEWMRPELYFKELSHFT